MDYKILIILLALAFLLILMYKEISVLKTQVSKTITSVSLQLKQNNDVMVSNLQSGMSKYVTQIKEIGSDNLQQLKKITLLNRQPITKINNFTETDESLNNNNPNNINTDKYYMSEKTPHLRATPVAEIKNNPEPDPEPDIPIYKPQIIEENSYSDSYTDSFQDSKISSNKNLSQKLTPAIPVQKTIIDDDYENLNMPPAINFKNDSKNKDEIEIEFNLVPGNLENHNIMANLENQDIYINNKTPEPNIPDKKPENQSDDTFNAEKNLNKIDLSESIKSIIKVQENLPEKSDKLELKPISDYNISELKKISKKYALPLTYKADEKFQTYRKVDLYNNLKNYLNNI